jgi:peptidoglycan/LPS O-acetylase OafA/YrhL
MAVVLYHFLYAGPIGGFYWGLPTIHMTSLGGLGVDVFFVISGLVIAISTEGRTAAGFAKARFLRLYPAFFVCSLLGAIAWLPSSAPLVEQTLKWAAPAVHMTLSITVSHRAVDIVRHPRRA